MDDQQKLPAMYGHAFNVYNIMKVDSQLAQIEDNPEPVRVWEGFLTKLFQDAHIAVPYYGPVSRILEGMGCITQLRRGGGRGMSLWAVWDEPTPEKFLAMNPDTSSSKGPVKVRQLQMEQQIRDIVSQLGGLDVAQAIADLARSNFELANRIRKLEALTDGSLTAG